MKRIIAIAVAVAIVATVLWIVNPFTPVYAEEYRSGFLLTPVSYDATGIYADTGFILKSEKSYTLEQMKEMLRMLGDNTLEITQNQQKHFVITPQKKLNTNSLYTFVLTTPDQETVSWTFQTRRDFSILGTLPADQSNYVPVNSGIEIYFSHTGFEDPGKYFQITPKVEGRFERNGYMAVFIPKQLEPGTLYTVTVRNGLGLKETDLKLPEDYVFSFETEPEQNGRTEQKGSLYFQSMLMEFGTGEVPVIPIGVYSANYQDTEAVVKTTVYQFKNINDFLKTLQSKYETPSWAYYSQQNNLISKEGLSTVSSFEQTFDMTKWQQKYLALPEELENGFYLIESTYNDLTAQVLVQSTDLAAYFTASDTKTLFWVNNLKTGKAESSATVYDASNSKNYTADAYGTVTFDTVPADPQSDKLEYYIVRSESNELILLNYKYRTYGNDVYAYEDYWRYFQTDRNLYKPDDPVVFWGFLQKRGYGTSPKKVTVEIAQGGYWGIPEARFLSFYLPSIQKPLVTIDVPVENGFFDSSFQLPKLSPGGYNIIIKADGQVVNNHYITVENYVKPAYKMSIEKDKEAIFLGETVNFTIIPAFFEGTPLPALDVSYNIGGYPLQEAYNTVKTGANGKLVVPFTAQTTDQKAQGEQHLYINANASLPESGEIYSNAYARVFINDIHAAFEANTDDKGKTTLKATVNKIDLSRINKPDNTDRSDFLGAPAAYKEIAGTIVYHYYEKIEQGEEYDYINKVVRKVYSYEERRETVQTFAFRTNEKGIASEVFNLKTPSGGWYTAELIWNDNNKRVMNSSVYLSSYRVKYPDTQYDWYHLETDKEKYRLDEEVTLTLKNNEQKIASPKSVLYVEAQKGILKYQVASSAEYKTKFTKNMVPNFYVTAVYFNGKGYINAGSKGIRYDTDEVKLDIQMEADKEAYRPSDTVNVSITAKDEDGNPVAAHVNLALIDEAMLKISWYEVNVLDTLYQWVDAGMGNSYSSHAMGTAGGRGAKYVERGFATGTNGMVDMAASYSVAEAAPTAPQSTPAADMGSVQVRSEFKDTALFRMVTLDENGTGTFSFKLPDNVTSWYVTLAGITPDLYGGTGEANLKVTLPFFINDSLNTTYLTGDTPFIGVSSYGNDLKEGETITWQIISPQKPGLVHTATGKAFERTNIPLWPLEEGVYDIEIRAISESGMSDGIKRTIYVTDTYHEIEKAVTETLRPNMILQGGKDGLTTLLFTDEGRGRLVPPLYHLMYSGGSRLDQKYTAWQAQLLLDKIAKDANRYFDAASVDLTQYQKPDGGYGILPYSESDVELSAQLAVLLKDESGAAMLKQYFYSLIFAEPGRVNAPALFGLAVMGEPVLVDLNNALKVSNLTTRDNIYLALAFDTLGETAVAQKIYNEKLVSLLENMKPYIRVKESTDTDTILRDTALAAVLAARLDTKDKEGLFQYTINNYSKKILVNTEKLLYVMEEYQKLPASEVEFTYTYGGNTYTESLKDGSGITVKVPSIKLNDLKITKVSGDASVVSIFEAPLTEQLNQDDNLTIKRTFYDYKTGKETTQFEQNDLVKVVLNWNVSPTAMDSYYEITDYVPSGLKPIDNPYNAGIREKGFWWWFRNTDGQKVTFNVWRDSENKEPLVYYCRVVSPGTFKADSTIIQGTLVKDSIKLGDEATIRIKE